MTPALPAFIRPGSLHSPTFYCMLCDPSVFYRIWFWPSADAENTKPDHDEKSLHRHTIPCFASSKSPFGLQLGSRGTPYASHPETDERCLRRNQRRAAKAFRVPCEPSTPRRDPKMGGLARSSRRRAQPFLPSYCCSKGSQACLPGLLCSSSHEGEKNSVQVTRWARTRSCSRSSILAPNSSESGSPPPSTRTAHWEDQKRNPPLTPDTVPSEAMKGHWTQEGYEGSFGTRRQTVLRPKAYVGLQPLGLNWGEEISDSPFVSTLSHPSRLGPHMQVFQQTSCSPYQTYPDPRFVYVGYKPAYGPSALHLPRAIWRGIVEVPTDVSKAEDAQPIGKGSRGRRTRRTPPPCPLRTTSLKARFPLSIHLRMFLRPISLQLEVGP